MAPNVVLACAPATERGKPLQLDIDPKGKTLLYTNGRSVVLRSLEDPRISQIYSEHSTAATVARFSPTGYYVASGGPFRAVTCSDDFLVNFYHGSPYKFAQSNSCHSRFVQSVRYSPSGDHFVSVGSDGMIYLYDGKTGEKIGSIHENDRHQGSIFAVSWNHDSTRFMTSSADTTVKIWDAETQKPIQTYQLSSNKAMEDQQMGNVWHDPYMLSVSLNGNINYLDPNSSNISKVIRGHQKSISSMQILPDKSIISCSYDGRALHWNSDNEANVVDGQGHSTQVVDMTLHHNQVFTVGIDDTLRSIDCDQIKFNSTALATGSLPKAVLSLDDIIVLVTIKQIQLIKDGQCIDKHDAPYEIKCATVSPLEKQIAVGGEGQYIHIYQVQDGKLSLFKILEKLMYSATYLAFSPDHRHLAICHGQGKIVVFTDSYQSTNGQWVYHSARITSFEWSADSLYAVSGSLDTNIYVWSVNSPSKHTCIKGAHHGGVAKVSFKKETLVASAGSDGCVKLFNVELP